jgi:5'-nucleotidase
MIKTILVDMDCILVDMLPPWIRRYNEVVGTNHTVGEVKNYDVGKVCQNQEVLYEILDEDQFFYNMEPMPGAVEYFQKLMDEGFDMVVVTQPPRRADLAIRDKRRWMKKYFPNFELANMIFCHRKDMIRGDVLFDDKPAHLVDWKHRNYDNLTATLDWEYNKDVLVDFRGSLKDGWKQFYEFVKEHNSKAPKEAIPACF